MSPFEHAEPFAPFAAWFTDARAAEPDVPDAVQLATVGADGRPSLRTVLLKGFDADGFVFYTNLGSRKAREIAANPHVAMLWHWKSLQRQVIVEGRAEPVAPEEADAYWATRPRGSQLGAWASRQGRALSDRDELAARLAAVEARFAGGPVPRPPFWSGFRVRPHRVEFWQGLPDRLHDRCAFEATDGGWARVRVSP